MIHILGFGAGLYIISQFLNQRCIQGSQGPIGPQGPQGPQGSSGQTFEKTKVVMSATQKDPKEPSVLEEEVSKMMAKK